MKEPRGAIQSQQRDDALLRGQLATMVALSRNYLFFPFAVLAMVASMMRPDSHPAYDVIPFVFLIASAIWNNRFADAFDRALPNLDAALWATRATLLAGANGAIWGFGALLWFAPNSFSEEAYLALAFLGMSATEFIARASYRPAYLAHAACSLAPLAMLLAYQGGPYQSLAAIVVLFFGAVLYGYGGNVGQLLEDGILLRHDNAQTIAHLGGEKQAAEDARDAAQASERAKSDFIVNISHELRTPLNAILGMAQLLERGDLEKPQRDHVKVLLEAGRGLKTLLDDVIALAQDENEPLAAPDESCEAAQAARTVARLLQPNAWEKRLRLSVNVAPGLPRVAADPRLLRRVLLKLVGNAIKFTERGHIEVALEETAGNRGQPMVRFTVTDTGPGIPQNMLSTIFEPFPKGEDSYAARHEGAGVGLAVAKRLIESLGGCVGVESEPGMGASFWMMVPAASAAPAEMRDTVEETTPPYGLALLLFVADDEVRGAVERLLAPYGNRITVAKSLAEASTMSARGGYAAVIAAAASVDALAAVPGQSTPLLAVAHTEERQPDGADNVLRWPASPSALYSALIAITGRPGTIPEDDSKGLEGAVDARAIAELEKSLGFKTLIDILQTYLKTAEDLATALSAASKSEDWKEAGRLAQDFAGAAGGLGLTALTVSARTLAQGARDGAAEKTLTNASGDVLGEHRRVREALRRLYPDLSA